MTEIGCYWACVSKEPRDSSDYRVLSCSAGHLAKYQALERPDRPGTPTTRASGRVESLPWVTFGRNGEAGHQLTMSIMTWAEHQDADGRPVTLTRFFLLPYAQLPSGIGYADLYRAAADVPLPPEAGAELVSLTLPDAPPPARHDLAWAAATAAVLLESRVIITGLQDASTEKRLAAVDAIVSMLPRGYRADLTVATWMSFPAQRMQRLCFGPYAAGDFTEVRLDANPIPRSGTARRYHALLLKHLARHQEPRHQEQSLIEWLARYSTPLSFASDPIAALDILQDLDLADAVVDEVRNGRGRWKRVLRALTERGPTAFDDKGLYDIFRFGLTERGVDAHKVFSQYWSPILCAAVVAAAHQASVPSERDRIASAFVPVAAANDELDAYLTNLVTPGAVGDPVPAEMFTVCLRALLDQPSSPYWPLLRRRMLENVPSGVSLVIECQDPYPERVPYVLSWLFDGHATDIPAWLAVLHHIAAGDPAVAEPSPELISPELIDEAIRQNPSTALQALDIASRRKGWDLLSAALWQRLIETAGRPPADPSRQVLVRDLNSLAPIEAGVRARACLDVVLETCALPAANPPVNTVILSGYVDELAGAIACVPVGQRGDVLRRLLVHVTEILTAEAPHAGWGPAVEFLLAVLNRLPAAKPADVADVVADILDRPGCGGLLRPLAARGGEQWDRLVTGSDRLSSVIPWLLFEESALAHASTDELARCWASVILVEHARNSPTRRPSIEALTGWSSLTQVDALLELINQTHNQLNDLGMPEQEAKQWQGQTLFQVARDQALGRPAAEALISSLRQVAAQTAQVHAKRLREIEQQETERRRQIKILQDELARLQADRAEIAEEDRRWERFFSNLSAKPQKQKWVPAVGSHNDRTDRSPEQVSEKKTRLFRR
jgi:hypothetical protein